MGELMGVKFGIYTVMDFSANARDVSVKSEAEGKWRALIHKEEDRDRGFISWRKLALTKGRKSAC